VQCIYPVAPKPIRLALDLESDRKNKKLSSDALWRWCFVQLLVVLLQRTMTKIGQCSNLRLQRRFVGAPGHHASFK
jgi:hypothetical protein